MRGSDKGAVSRAYLHSAVAESLRYAVVEIESVFAAKLTHAVMIAALYGNPRADLDQGNDQLHEMYLSALKTLPYFRKVVKKASKSDTESLVEEWRRINSGEKEEEGGDVRDD